MSNRPQTQPLFTQVEVSSNLPTATPDSGSSEQSVVMRQILTVLERQTEVLEEILSQTNAAQRQRATELGNWKQANPELSRNCRLAAETLSRVQTAYLDSLTREVTENADVLMDGEFMLTEFVDRFGPRLAHLNGVLQVLTQLAGNPQ